MKQNLILVVILLATLLMVNAIPHHLRKRATTFGPCNTTDPTDPTATPPPELTVSISPDPPTQGADCTFTVAGSIAVAAGDVLYVATVDSTGAFNLDPSIDLCSSGVTCPADSLSITTTASIPTETGDYSIVVFVADATNTTMLGCAVGVVSAATA